MWSQYTTSRLPASEPVKPLEAGPDIDVAFRAELIDRNHPFHHQIVRPGFVDRVTGYTSHLILRVAAVYASDIGRLIQMTAKTDAVCLGGECLFGIGKAADMDSPCLLPGP